MAGGAPVSVPKTEVLTLSKVHISGRPVSKVASKPRLLSSKHTYVCCACHGKWSSMLHQEH